ncbi:synaptotagmin-like protein 2 isoform X2 [Xyrauchen texanus]|uniref:synaptotagmin-like protein 2 isoform X2 n=1 Tax=Xyrauchen texanus TaxID=154827 RepID=UPI002241B566|nr:synaptotagmin-like protein 2 isoform X2 [Xyrauchen texanus]
MKQYKSAPDLIDLSFLSAEEEAAIRQVLLRDEDLKRLESGRVRNLRQSVPDLKQLKTLTGEWFEELKVKRYGQQTDVTAVVRSSMRWKKTAAHKPNPFLKDILEENKDGEKKEHNTAPNPSADPRLIHPALRKETYHQYTDEDFMDDGNKHPTSFLDTSVEASTIPSYTVDACEDEGVDSDDDDSLSSRKGYSESGLSLTDRTGSLLSVYSNAGDFGDVEAQGSVEFAMMYSPVGELIIMIEKCQDLAIAIPRKQRTDPYVKTYLYPDKSHRSKRKTSIKKHTVNPVYVESLRYKVKREELPEKTLNLSVWHNDSRGRNMFLGQVEISLKTWDWGHEALSWYNLQPKTAENQESQESHGSLSVSLKYVPPETTGGLKNNTGEIHVWLQEAKELRRLKPQGVDSFVKCYILPDSRKKSRQKTHVVKKTQDPVYNHVMVYDGFKAGEVSETCCELTVWDHNALSNQFLGGLRLSLGTGQSYGKKVDWMDSMNEEAEIWKRMLANPNSWVETELPLRSSMTSSK